VNCSGLPAGRNWWSLKVILLAAALFFSISAAVLYFYVSNAATVIGTTPDQAITLAAGTNNGILSPGERRWFRLMPDEHGGTFQDIKLNLTFSASGPVPSQNVNFQLFAPGEVQAWQQGLKPQPVNFGAGMVVGSPGTHRTGERVWQGTILGDTTYYVAVDNATAETVDYRLFDDETPASPPSEPVPEAAPLTVVADRVGDSPMMAITFAADRHIGKLQPGTEVWYRLVVGDSHPDQFEPVALTLVTTPHHIWPIAGVNLEIFTPQAVQVWSPENRNGLTNLGTASEASRDNNPQTGEKVWGGWLVNGETFYIRIANNTGGEIDYWLFNGDIYSPQLN
jgi:hypothetical protein